MNMQNQEPTWDTLVENKPTAPPKPPLTPEQQTVHAEKFTVQQGSPALNSKDAERANELIKKIVDRTPQDSIALPKQEVLTVTQREPKTETSIQNQERDNIGQAERFLGQDIKGMTSNELERAINDREGDKNLSAKVGFEISSGIAALGVVSGLMAPAAIGLTPSLATALPSFMTSVVSIGGIGIASSAVVLGGAGLAVGVIGYGVYKLRNFFTKRNAEKARRVALDKELDELL